MDVADLDRLLIQLGELDGSDLHIKAGAPPRMRIAGALRTVEGEAAFTAAETHADRRGDDDRAGARDVPRPSTRPTSPTASPASAGSGSTPTTSGPRPPWPSGGCGRRRPRPRSSGSRPVVTQLAEEMRGLVLVTGPTGSGKTTTLAAMIDHINHLRSCHIVTIEDPVEVMHKDDLAAIDQREVGFDTDSFSSAMRVVLRQDPDVILVGEMRDQETVAAALSAAETGHLVFSTLHTINSTETVNRIVDFFPPHQQSQIRLSLAGSLKGIVCQRLIPTVDGDSRVPGARGPGHQRSDPAGHHRPAAHRRHRGRSWPTAPTTAW